VTFNQVAKNTLLYPQLMDTNTYINEINTDIQKAIQQAKIIRLYLLLINKIQAYKRIKESNRLQVQCTKSMKIHL